MESGQFSMLLFVPDRCTKFFGDDIHYPINQLERQEETPTATLIHEASLEYEATRVLLAV